MAIIKDAGFTLPESPKKIKEELYSERFSCPSCNLSFAEIEPRLFSFNSPVGACSRCRGLGNVLKVDKNLIINPSLSITEGAIFPFQKLFFTDTWFARLFKVVLSKYEINAQKPLDQLSTQQKKILFKGNNELLAVHGNNREGINTVIYERWRGIIGELEHRYYQSDSDYTRQELEKYMRAEICPDCKGAKLKPAALSVTIAQKNINELTKLTIQAELDFCRQISKDFTKKEKQIATPILKEIITRLQFLINVGLDYLTLERRAKTLSGGEAQRIRLASQIGTGLTGITYVLDEPSIGLHARDIQRLLEALLHLRDLQNTVIVVEHDWNTIKAADWIVDFGPLAGQQGGEIIYNGPSQGLFKCAKSLTSQYLRKKKQVPTERDSNPPKAFLVFSGCQQHNLQTIEARIPLQRIVGITGVSGSGKSSLLLDTVYTVTESQVNHYYKGPIGKVEGFKGIDQIQRVVLVDQSPIGRTPRSNPATYTGVFTSIREIFASTIEAKAQGFKPGRFSFNVKGGRCENCQGAGLIKVEMQFLADVYVKCDVCHGHRYNQETLSVLYKGRNIYEVLEMTVSEALVFFTHHWKIMRILNSLHNVGLEYLKLGQPAPTLSGGEAQRVKLAKELYTSVKFHSLYLLDEPTTGLHFYDIEKLIKVLRNLVQQGNTVVIIEHNFEIIKNCDYLIDLGPDGGEAGGKILYQGNFQDFVKKNHSHTAKYLRQYLNEG